MEPDAKLEVLTSALLRIQEGASDAARELLIELRSADPPSVSDRQSISIPKQVQIFQRDRFTCRYCGQRTVCPPALRLLSALYPRELPYDYHWRYTVTHPLYYDICSSCDHLRPVARGGLNDMDNLITSCYKCNSMKSGYTLEELHWILLPITDKEWDGLSNRFAETMVSFDHAGLLNRELQNPDDRKFLDKWRKAILSSSKAPTTIQDSFDF